MVLMLYFFKIFLCLLATITFKLQDGFNVMTEHCFILKGKNIACMYTVYRAAEAQRLETQSCDWKVISSVPEKERKPLSDLKV